MRVVLLDNIKGIGRVGDIKDVNDGYARNFLLPRKLAKPVTPGVLSDVEAVKAKKLEALSLKEQEAKELAQKLNGSTVEVSGRANGQGTLFAGIEEKHVAHALSAAAGIHIAPESVRMGGHIKMLGEHPVTIELAEGVTATVTVVVSREA